MENRNDKNLGKKVVLELYELAKKYNPNSQSEEERAEKKLIFQKAWSKYVDLTGGKYYYEDIVDLLQHPEKNGLGPEEYFSLSKGQRRIIAMNKWFEEIRDEYGL